MIIKNMNCQRNIFNNKSGFTLIEIIVVLIIVGILAAIALPNLFRNVTKSKATEAVVNLETLKVQVEACQQARITTANTDCDFTVANNLGGLSNPSNANFTYAWGTKPQNNKAQTGATGQTYSITATYVANNADIVTLTRTTGASFTCSGASEFAGVC